MKAFLNISTYQYLIDNRSTRRKLCENSIEIVKKSKIDTIVKEWQSIFKSLKK